jgi:hypothetical protein
MIKLLNGFDLKDFYNLESILSTGARRKCYSSTNSDNYKLCPTILCVLYTNEISVNLLVQKLHLEHFEIDS